ncbi:hypothetical protein EW146_g2562 [Bondarzewia mesenterica]|uniref:Phosphoglycerate mutase (2,3-diphosphoglycerate-dependent) n=1 Tax=Bondarzewia mesenterica TaxID=1095465 RepID=A0A4S4M1S8_9AGAM|nr:hypothetical protein EW146_g2562 [Bondarzewia mesenterica]
MAAVPMPRLIVIRHGETEWSLNGRHTGTTDIPLTARGEDQIKSKARSLVGEGSVSFTAIIMERYRAEADRQRAHKTFHLLFDHLPELPNHSITETVREKSGLGNLEGWVREYHRRWKEESKGTRDVVIVAHGHFNRCLFTRWIKLPLALGTHFNAEPAGIAVLSYNHNSFDEPALNALNLNAA